MNTAHPRLLRLNFVSVIFFIPKTTYISTGPVQEISLSRPIQEFLPALNGIGLVLKTWDQYYECHGRFSIRLFSEITSPDIPKGSLEEIYAFDADKRLYPITREEADCSVQQTMLLRSESPSGPIVTLITADRVEADGPGIPVQSAPRAQLLRKLHVEKNDRSQPDRGSLWLNTVSKRVTEEFLCSSDNVRAAMESVARER